MSKLFFHHIAPASPDPIFGLQVEFEADRRPEKVNLSVGVYKDDRLQTPVLEVVKEAEAVLIQEELSKNYLPIGGRVQFLQKVGALVFGDVFWAAERARICGVQTPGGTGSLRIGGEFLKQEVGDRVAISDPTWPNHKAVFERCGMKVVHYPYYDQHSHRVHFERVCQYLRQLTPGTVVVLHACCHNPTGADFTQEEWQELLVIFLENGLLPFFDFAYQGFGSGLEEDAFAIRLFAQGRLEMLVAVSQSKNFGLYSERIGALFVVTDSEKTVKTLASKIETIIRTNYSNPPRHGASVVEHILSTSQLRMKWERELAVMRERIVKLRQMFTHELTSRDLGKDYHYLAKGVGMFCYTGLGQKEVEQLQREFAIYLTLDGRMNVAGLTEHSLVKVASAIEHIIRFT
jgi:aspartate/tyrosine/aromatic aminotransferase